MPKHITPHTTRQQFVDFGKVFLNTLAVAADRPTMTRMTELEHEIDKLQEDYAHLNEKLDSDRRRPLPYQK